jgi:hypothetical protein
MGNQELLSLIHMASPCLASIGVIVEGISSWFHMFQFLSFSFLRKDCNKAVQALAIETLSSTSKHVWLEDYLTCITTFVQLDSMQ